MTFVQTDTIRLRRLCADDLAAFQAYRGDAQVGLYQGWSAMTDDRALGFLNHMAGAPVPSRGEWCQIAIAQVSDDTLIGDFGLHVSADETEAELGITLSRSAQGKSLGFEAVNSVVRWIFDQTAVAKIVAITDAENTGAQALLARLGWPQVGVLGPEVEIEGRTEYVFEVQRPQ